MAYADAAAEGHELPASGLADRLRRGGYRVRMRTALGGAGAGGSIDGECLRNLRHSFLTVSLPGPGASTSWLPGLPPIRLVTHVWLLSTGNIVGRLRSHTSDALCP